MRHHAGEPSRHIFWDKDNGHDGSAEWSSDWAATAGELDSGLPLHSGRALTWLSAAQAIIQVSGLLFIIYTCLQ
ncbi:hypothetical protein [Rhizobium sp. C4]|uniref:hypothetical protein n=1 Tax=Rhizobium sp. C4 TaxID=1349800 RepID=UPI001E51FFDE|nr:hypothetical protein [Rhizobium sp. C4]MCD2173386.1 hypothetical protein [Rhizobium sp. C4]